MTATPSVDSYRSIEGEHRPRLEDQDQLAALMLAAYRGSVDEEEETMEQAAIELRKTFTGAYGPFLPQCSRVIERNGQIVAATLVTGWQDRPFVAFAMTAPEFKRQGIARASMLNTMQDVLKCGESLLSLVVTVQNEPAFNLYQSLGFVSGR